MKGVRVPLFSLLYSTKLCESTIILCSVTIFPTNLVFEVFIQSVF